MNNTVCKGKIWLMASGIFAALAASAAAPSLAASSFSLSTSLPPPPPPRITVTPPPPPPPVTVQTPPPPPRVMPPMTIPTTVLPPGPLATDLTHVDVSVALPNTGASSAGIKTIAEGQFPTDGAGDGDYLLARGDKNSVFHKASPHCVVVEKGNVLISMRRPSRVGLVNFQYGQIGLTGDADIMLTSSQTGIRLINLSGRGEVVKVKFDRGPFNPQNANFIALAPGYELVASDHALHRSEIRLADGYARRNFRVFEEGKLAVCEISAESVLTSSAVVAQMVSQSDNKERRILSDMSKMAAVLNYVNGTEGFSREAESQLAHR